MKQVMQVTKRPLWARVAAMAYRIVGWPNCHCIWLIIAVIFVPPLGRLALRGWQMFHPEPGLSAEENNVFHARILVDNVMQPVRDATHDVVTIRAIGCNNAATMTRPRTPPLAQCSRQTA